MPKPGQGNRGGGSKKPPPKSATDGDDSYIVFSNAKDDKKSKKAEDKAPAGKDGSNSTHPTGEDAPKRPDTRKLIGGASWTGKLPVNMLSEHCQKQRWEKPEYTMSKTPEGYSSMVILKATNPKTKELTALPPFKLPPIHKHLAAQPTAVEARHFAATYALFRVCSMRNIHMMLPPAYRDLWKGEFQELKKEDVKEGRAWMYEADPFAAKAEREEAQAITAKRRAEREKQAAKEAEQATGLGLPQASGSGGASRNIMRGWTRVPKIEMGKRTRTHIEDLVRRHAVWNPHGTRMSEFQGRNILNEFIDLGFRKSHIEEAVGDCKDREEALEWLLIHVPEDDLPKWSLPEGYVAGISMASGNLKREASIKRLAEAGYSAELCEKLLDKYGGDEGRTAEALQNMLIGHGEAEADQKFPDVSKLAIEEDEQQYAAWSEEQSTLAAIFGDRFTSLSPETCQIQLNIPHFQGSCTANIRRPKPYPSIAPVVSLSSAGLPAYIRLSIIRQVVNHANEDLLGEPMIFNMVDWLEAEIPRIIENPGKLRDVSAGASAIGDVRSVPTQNRNQHTRRVPRPIDWRPGNLQSMAILDRWRSSQESSQQRKMLAARQSLPAWSLRDAIITAVNEHQVTIISGETGSGKSTQSVQFILDDMIQRKLGAAANIVCTQPRRISALGLADRVSDERCSPVGDEIGYAIRGESKQKPGITKITFVTTGVLLRRLQASGGSSDDVLAALAEVSHVVVDEVHERSLDTDFLLVLFRDALSKRKDLKVILMSATLDAGVFERYFSGGSSVGKVEIQGRTFPVDDYYLDDVLRQTGFNAGTRGGDIDDSGMEDMLPSVAHAIQTIGMRINYNLIAETVRAIDAQLGSQEGGILIFLPGTLEINRTLDAIRAIQNVHALPLHASLMPAEQRRVFPPAPKGKRKVIAATNVAETSITIEDIVAVIDTGKVKETSFDPQNNMVKLEEVWASRAACKQRRGRAGRVRAGKCYKLYTRNAEAKMMERPEPEIRRVPLEQLCLSVRAMGVQNVLAFLASALTPPESMAVEGAIDLLGRMGALDGDELTALGRHLAMIPADLRCGKLMVYGATFGCLEACLTIAAILTVRSPFISPQAKREESKEARSTFAQGQGDLLGDLRAYEEWSEMRKASHQREVRMWCDQYFLSHQTLNDISSNRSQYLSSLKEAGFIPTNYHSSSPATHTSLNAYNDNSALIRALVAGAFNPQLARIEFPEKKFAPSMSGAVELDPEARTIKYFNQDNGRVFVHPSSTLFDAQSFPGGAAYMSYFNKMATSKVFIRDLTPFNAYTLLLFSAPPRLDTLGRGLLVDNWLRLRGWARIGVLVSRLREMLDEVLARKIEDPGWDLSGEEVVGVARKLVELDGLDR
ncbi:dead deah box helicase [Lasallia pustulata]|uniref:Dead deah box helicase n=1 Tax=Lasallia pustulata TaxID=136370 RepID=A0A1W5D5H3_9LECA|nr:dead deah box helicase [Lasallia pustulata]